MASHEILKNMIDTDLSVMVREIGEFVQEHELIELIKDIALPAKIEDFQLAIDEMINAENKAKPAAQAFAALSAINAQLAYLDARLNYFVSMQTISQTVSTAWNNLKNYLQSIFQSISQHLWQLISQLLTFKEWSVSGDAGVNVFGLTGTAKVELKFGP